MNQALLKDIGIDCGKGIERCMGDEALYIRLLEDFLTDTHLREARKCLLHRDYDGLRTHLLEIKGLSGNLGIDEIYEHCLTALKFLKENSYAELQLSFEHLASGYDFIYNTIQLALV